MNESLRHLPKNARRFVAPAFITATALLMGCRETNEENVLATIPATPITNAAADSPTPKPPETATPNVEPTRSPTAISTATVRPTETATPRPTETATAVPKATATPRLIETPIFSTKELQIEIGAKEKINLPNIQWYPDGHISFIKMPNNELRFWMAALQSGYMIAGKNINNLTKVEKVIGPSGEEDFDRNYAAPGSVIQGINENELLMFYHGEYHPNQPTSFPFKAGIGLAISQDGGTTWEKKGQIIKGNNDKLEKDRPSGAGQPSAIIIGNYIFLYYIDWNSEYPDAIHLARAPIESNGVPGSWEKFHNGSFNSKEVDDLSSPVVFPPKDQGYSALPGVSWNSYLNRFLMVFEGKEGCFITTSSDGINWSSPTSLLKVKTANNNPQSGDIWNSYPTLLSPNASNDRETDQEMLLVFSEGKWQKEPHSMMTRGKKLK